MSLAEDVTADIKAAHGAYQLMNASLLEFQAACIKKDWIAAQAAHDRVVAATEAYLNHMAAGYKRMERP